MNKILRCLTSNLVSCLCTHHLQGEKVEFYYHRNISWQNFLRRWETPLLDSSKRVKITHFKISLKPVESSNQVQSQWFHIKKKTKTVASWKFSLDTAVKLASRKNHYLNLICTFRGVMTESLFSMHRQSEKLLNMFKWTADILIQTLNSVPIVNAGCKLQSSDM